MLSLTDIPTVEERKHALAALPFHVRVRDLAGYVAGVMRNQSIDLIDVALVQRSVSSLYM